MKNSIKLAVAVVAIVAVTGCWLIPWKRIATARQQAAFEQRQEAQAQAEFDDWMIEPIRPGTMFDLRVEGMVGVESKVDASGVPYDQYPDGSIAYSGQRPDVKPARPSAEYAKAKKAMYDRLAELYDPDEHGPLLDHRHEDNNRVYFLLDGERVDVVTQ